MITFTVPQTGNLMTFDNIEAARATMHNNFINRTDAVIMEDVEEAGRVSFTYRDLYRKIIFYAKQK